MHLAAMRPWVNPPVPPALCTAYSQGDMMSLHHNIGSMIKLRDIIPPDLVPCVFNTDGTHSAPNDHLPGEASSGKNGMHAKGLPQTIAPPAHHATTARAC